MSYTFNRYGWYAGESTTRRGTDMAPINTSTTEIVGELRSMWNEKGWSNIAYFAPPVEVDTTIEDLRNRLASRQNKAINQPYTIKGVEVQASELENIRTLLGGAGTKKFSFYHGTMTLTAANRTSALAGMDARLQAAHDRAYDIVELVKAASGREARLAVFYAEIDQGWPT